MWLDNKQYAIGIDIGGTKFFVGLIDNNYELIGRIKKDTRVKEGAKAIIEDICLGIKEVLNKFKLSIKDLGGIGIGFPGTISEDGIVKYAPNLNWEDVPLKTEIKDILKFEKPIKISNDVNTAALAEYRVGAGIGCENMLCMTLGTGIGGGIVINGKLVEGFSGNAGEIGHIVIEKDGRKCGCGNKGCFEAYGSATAVVKIFKEKLKADSKSKLKVSNKIMAKDILDAAKSGDKLCLEVVDFVAKSLGHGISIIATILNPEVIVVGGGLGQAGDFLFDKVKNYLSKFIYKMSLDGLKIVPAKLGEEAGCIGAALLVQSND